MECGGNDSCRMQGNWQLWIAAGELTAVDCRGNDSCRLQGNYQLKIAVELTALDCG